MRDLSSVQASRLAASAPPGIPNPYLTKHNLSAWGIDFSTKAIDVGVIAGHSRPRWAHRRLMLPGSNDDEPTLLRCVCWELADLIEEVLEYKQRENTWQQPGIICVEIPIAINQRAIMNQLYGAVHAAIAAGYRLARKPVPIVMNVEPSAIKAEVYGTGKATKADAITWMNKAFGIASLNRDDNAADALAAAAYARNTEIVPVPF